MQRVDTLDCRHISESGSPCEIRSLDVDVAVVDSIEELFYSRGNPLYNKLRATPLCTDRPEIASLDDTRLVVVIAQCVGAQPSSRGCSRRLLAATVGCARRSP
jgi:hypothetical protein